MFHQYQLSQLPTSLQKSAGVNIELEAYIAQYKFLQKQGELDNPRWVRMYDKTPIGRNIARLSNDYISSNGSLIDSNKNYSFNSLFAGTGLMMEDYYNRDPKNERQFDGNRSVGDNLQNLRNLTKNC
jgi:hypothetical protein